MVLILTEYVLHSRKLCGRVLLEFVEVGLMRTQAEQPKTFAALVKELKTKDIEMMAIAIKKICDKGK